MLKNNTVASGDVIILHRTHMLPILEDVLSKHF